MESHWINQRPGYRCRHGHTRPNSPPTAGARSSTSGKTTSSQDPPVIPTSPATPKAHTTWPRSCTGTRSPSVRSRELHTDHRKHPPRSTPDDLASQSHGKPLC
ncbi:hypothetical protein [Micromonospora sp. AMSO12t]|uniref:hypothetical protein n=1 Tax=Micromonospora sp. AMSO12t TaxID=2650410 RepID=UPI00210655CD|nr:hypothetical protein [Micromonospora sp. AMSO12t]